jgi:hypothetical protein
LELSSVSGRERIIETIRSKRRSRRMPHDVHRQAAIICVDHGWLIVKEAAYPMARASRSSTHGRVIISHVGEILILIEKKGFSRSGSSRLRSTSRYSLDALSFDDVFN